MTASPDGPTPGAASRSRRRGLAAVAALIPLGLAVWAFAIEPASLGVETVPLPLSAWPARCGGLRVAVLADLHVGAPWIGLDKLDALVAATNAARPDLVLIAGDLVIHGVVGGRFVPPEQAASGLAKLRAPLGVFGVLGNHDHWLDGPRVQRALEAVGIPMLEDRAVVLERGDCRLGLVGLSDLWEGRHDLTAALAGVASERAEDLPVVLFTHNPDVFPEIPARVALTVAGHTHGGQVDLPLLGRLVVPSHFGDLYAAGRIDEGGRTMFVSTGVGTSILPVRFRVPPVISLLVLQPAP